MLSDEYPEMGVVGPQALGGTTFSIHLHVDDADAWIARAVEAGATIVRPATDAFYGERGGTVRDPFGHEWMLGHQIEEVSSEEMQRRYTALFASK
jgi:PhnB protein